MAKDAKLVSKDGNDAITSGKRANPFNTGNRKSTRSIKRKSKRK